MGRDAGASACIHHVVWCRSHLDPLFSIICFLRAKGEARGATADVCLSLYLFIFSANYISETAA